MADILLTAVGVTFAHARTKFSLQVKKLGQQGKNSGITMIFLAMLLFCSLLTLHFFFFFFLCVVNQESYPQPPAFGELNFSRYWKKTCLFPKSSQQHSSKLIQNLQNPSSRVSHFLLVNSTWFEKNSIRIESNRVTCFRKLKWTKKTSLLHIY